MVLFVDLWSGFGSILSLIQFMKWVWFGLGFELFKDSISRLAF